MVLDRESGQLQKQSLSQDFALHFQGGIPLKKREAPAQEPVGMVADRVPRASATPEVIAEIQKVASRYDQHTGIRRAGLSSDDWLALFRASIEVESGYNPQARSHKGAIGLGQLMPDTARTLGVDPFNMSQNLDGSARYLLMLLDRFGSIELAIAGYNAGPHAVEKYSGIPPYKETRGHVSKVLGVFSRLKRSEL